MSYCIGSSQLFYQKLDLYRSAPTFSKLINEMMSDRLFQVHLNGKRSRFRTLQNGLPQGSTLSPLLFNIYTSDVPPTTSRKFIYADDTALGVQDKGLLKCQEVLEEDLLIMSEYFKKWGLQPNPGKTEVTAFHLNNKEANQQLHIESEGVVLKHNPTPKYLGVTLDRTLTFKPHLQKLASKVRTRNSIIQKLANSSWGATAEVLRTSALSLVFSTGEYCAPVWLNSHHTSIIDTQLNHTMRQISGTIKPTPNAWLPVLCNIAPPNTRRMASLKAQVTKCQNNPTLPINADIEDLTSKKQPRLKSRQPPVRTATQLTNFTSEQHWSNEWHSKDIRNSYLIQDPTAKPNGFNLPRRQWCNLNRIRTGHGVCNKTLNQWGITDSPQCDKCGADEQTIHHLITECPHTQFDGSLKDIHILTSQAEEWLRETTLRL